MRGRTTLVLMTALVPTVGYRALLDFAAGISEQVVVMVNGRTCEPVPIQQRVAALREYAAQYAHMRIEGVMDDDAPQNPPDHPQFWEYWKDAILEAFPGVDFTGCNVVASEGYGQNLADMFDGTFYPFDLERELCPARGSDVRQDLWGSWYQVLPEFRRNLQVTVTLFGQESVGKTTITQALADEDGFATIPEYARLYLETVGEDLSQEKMDAISHGQAALLAMYCRGAHAPVLAQDTDLYSTIGYCKIGNYELPPDIEQFAHLLRSDMYYVLPDDVPFAPDILRYGGDVRESNTEFWLELLDKYDLPYVQVPRLPLARKIGFVRDHARSLFERKTRAIREFVRE